MRKFVLVCIVLALVLPALGKGGKSSTGKSAGKSSSSSKSVHVRGYYRKDGTYAKPHYRSAPGTATHGSTTPTAGARYNPHYIAPGYTPHLTVRVDGHGKIHRSKAARAAFMRTHPCPGTGRTSGRCSGYVVDHRQALACGGADDPGNMQWQTVEAAKAKDKTELWCR